MTACSSRSFARGLACLLVLVLGFAVVGVVSAPAIAVDDAHLVGRLTGTSGEPAAGVFVVLHKETALPGGGRRWDETGYAHTSANGTYDLAGLSAGTYRLEFRGNDRYAGEYWDDVHDFFDAADIGVPQSGRVVRSARLDPAARLAGRVTGPDGNPVPGVYVAAYPGQYSSATIGSTYTAADGSYTIGGLAVGSYRIGFPNSGTTGYQEEYWDDKATLDQATPIPVAVGETVGGKDAQLSVASHITGQVTLTPGGPGTDVGVHVYARDATNRYWQYLKRIVVPSGRYDIGGLRAGRYRICFGPLDAAYVDECWDDAPLVDEARTIVVPADATVRGRDAVLALSGRVSGVVRGPDGRPTDRAAVTALRQDPQSGEWEFEGRDYVDPGDGGAYEIGRLPAGTYRLSFESLVDTMLSEWWDDQPSQETAVTFVVGAGQTVSGKNARLARAGRISGRVTRTDGSPVAYASVVAVGVVDGQEAWGRGSGTGPDGTFDIGALPPGRYRLRFEDEGGRELATEWWDDKPTFEAARDIVVGRGTIITGKDAVLTVDGPPTRVANVERPQVSGAAVVGRSVTVTTGTWTPSAVTRSYQWYVDGMAVAGATNRTYVPVADDAGKPLKVRVQADAAGYGPGRIVVVAGRVTAQS